MKKKFGTFDIESNNWIEFELLGRFDGVEYRTHNKIGAFLDEIDSRKYNGWTWYAHFGGRFDFLFLIEEMYRRGYTVSLLPRNGSILCVDVMTAKYRYTLADSYALLPAKQKDLATAFGVAHEKIDFDFKTKRVVRSDPELRRRLENDCVGLHEILTAFFSSEFVVNPKLTIASQAMDTFKHNFKPHEIQLQQIDNEELFRQHFYAGGRVEVFKGRGVVNSYDVNSLYPSAMLNLMPTGDARYTRTFKADHIGFYKVRIDSTPRWYVSPLLVKDKKNMFVNGAGEYYLSSATMLFLKSEFGIRFKILDGWYFTGAEYLFNEYVDFFYKIKSENKNNAKYYIAKFFLNSLYGKFGQKRLKEKVETYNGQTKYISMDESPTARNLGLVLVEYRSRSKFILPYLAAYITDLARLSHFKMMNEHADEMFYCDTDSLFTSAEYPTGKKIGQLDFKGRYDGIFINNKTYALRDVVTKKEHIKFKGFDASEFTFKKFAAALKNRTGFSQVKTRMLSYAECLRRKNGIVGNEGIFLKTVEMEKDSVFSYDKRQVIPSARFAFDTKTYYYSHIH